MSTILYCRSRYDKWIISPSRRNTPVPQDVTFHQAVNLGRYNVEKVVSFVPPDGEFELMKYRCQDGISSPFTVLPIITEQGRTRVEVSMLLMKRGHWRS